MKLLASTLGGGGGGRGDDRLSEVSSLSSSSSSKKTTSDISETPFASPAAGVLSAPDSLSDLSPASSVHSKTKKVASSRLLTSAATAAAADTARRPPSSVGSSQTIGSSILESPSEEHNSTSLSHEAKSSSDQCNVCSTKAEQLCSRHFRTVQVNNL